MNRKTITLDKLKFTVLEDKTAIVEVEEKVQVLSKKALFLLYKEIGDLINE
jgi:hypothetical protein